MRTKAKPIDHMPKVGETVLIITSGRYVDAEIRAKEKKTFRLIYIKGKKRMSATKTVKELFERVE